MNNPSAEIVNSIRKVFPAGCRVKLLQMNDPWREMPEGLCGTVIHVDDMGTVHVNWENGSSLGVVYGVDRIQRVYPNTRVNYDYRDASNYKCTNSIVVHGEISEDQVKTILDCCDGENFIPEQIGWDLLRGWDITEDDHCYAELDSNSFEPTDDDATSDMTVDEMVQAFRSCKQKWNPGKYAPEVY